MKIRLTALSLLLLTIFFPAYGQDQEDKKATCQIRVRIINYDWNNANEFRLDSLSANQIEWWLKDGQRKFPDVCITTEKGIADYVIAWTATESIYTYTYTIPNTTTTDHQGTISTTTSSGTYTGTSTSTTYESKQGTRAIFFVNAFVYKTVEEMGKRKTEGMPIFVAKHKGQWRWSKPDKDAFEKAIKRINKERPKSY